MQRAQRGKRRTRPAKGTASEEGSFDQSTEHNEDEGAKQPNLTRVRLAWLEHCCCDSAVGGGLALRLAGLFSLRYVTLPRSRAQFEADGIPVCWPPQPSLAQALGCSRQGVAQAARKLAKLGYLNIVPGHGRGNATKYRLMGKGKQLSCLFQTSKRQQRAPEKATRRFAKGNRVFQKRQAAQLPHHSYSFPYNQSTSQSPESGGSDVVRKVKGKLNGSTPVKHPEFEELFRLWPNENKDHGKALGAWINHVDKAEVDAALVLKRGRAWCRYWRAEVAEGGFTPFFGKWLATRGWEKRAPEHDKGLAGYFELVERCDREAATKRLQPLPADDDENG